MTTHLPMTDVSRLKAHLYRKKKLRLLFFLVINLLTTSFVFASHFRYGLVTATRLSETGTTVTYRINVSEAWRLGAANAVSSFTISGGNSGSFNVNMTTVTDPSGGWSNNTGTATITLNKTSTPTRIEFTSCCKISTTINNHDANWDEYIILNTNAPGSSPVSTLPAIINMPVNAAAATYSIPASDPDAGSTLTYGTPDFVNSQLAGQTEPSGFSINSTTGQITLNTIGKTVGQQYNAMVTVTDNNGNQIMLDFIINMVGASNPPSFDYTVTPSNGFVYNVIAGQNISFPIKATDVDGGSTVGLSVSGLPAYITTSNFSPSLPANGNPSQTTFSWTPAGAQIGTTNVLNFIATDNVGVQTTSSVTIKVVAEPAPVFISPSPGQSTLRQITTGVLHQDNIVAQSSLGSNVSIAFAGIPNGASLTPSVPTAGANPGQTTLSWTPTPADFGQHTLAYQATISAFPTIFTSLSYDIIVNTPPVFTSFPNQLTVNAGQSFSYSVTVSDPDIPYGDIIDINATTLPSWLTLTSTGNGTAVLSGTPTFANGGINAVELEAEDTYHHGNPSHVHQEFDIVVVTCIQPVITCPSNITVNATKGLCGAKVNYAANISGTSPSVSYSIPSGSLFAVGTTTVNIAATNDCGSANCSFTVTVNSGDIDGDGVADVCDLDNDNDGLTDATECNKSNFFWSNPPSISGNTASGTINGIPYTYTSSSTVTTTTYMYGNGTPFTTFPASYGVPNVNPTIQNTQVTNNTLSFASPMTNPVLVFASIGNSGTPVGITFNNPIQVVWSQSVTLDNPQQITGREGYAIIRFNGTFSSISFNYTVAENWCNFAFGADFQTCGDTDNDGTPDYLDADSDNDGCTDALEGSLNILLSQIAGGKITGAVSSTGIPVLAGSGQATGTSQSYAANCACQSGNDLIPPAITAPANVNKVIPACQSGNASVALGTPTVNDNCAITVTNNAPSTFGLGNTSVTWTATDAAGNSATATQIINVSQAPPVAVTYVKDINCSGVNSGSIAVTASQGNAPYQYQLNTGAFQAGNVFSNLTPGVYSVTVKDADNCSVTVNQITLTEPFCLQAVNDSFNNCAGRSITIQKSTLLANDANPWNVGVYIDVAQPANGSIVDNGGSFTYTPDANFSGIDQLNYTIKKNDGTLAFAGNGHVYEWVPFAGISWNSARAAAALRYYNGMQGYLVTVTSQAEMNFVAGKLQGSGWMGASDRAYEGTWRWVTGPEGLEEGGQGRHFSDQFKYPSAYGNCAAGTAPALIGQYANWAGGEPNDCGANLNQYFPNDINRAGEHYAHFYGTGIWNDYPDVVGGNSILGYIVEYGGMEGPIASTGTSTASVVINNFKVLISESIAHETCPGAANGSITVSASGGKAPYSYNWGGGITTATRNNLTAGTYSVTVTDALGCNATKSFIIKMTDNSAPIVVTQPVTAYLNANGVASITPAQVNNGSTDNCTITNYALSKSTFTCANTGTQTVTLFVTDNSNNVGSATATVTIIDNIAPVISCPADILAYATSAAGAAVTFPTPAASDNCSATVAQTAGLGSGSIFPIGISTVIFEATDASGNTSNCTLTITVKGLPPVIVSPGDITVTNTAGLCSGVPLFAATETTAIPASVITYSQNPGTVFPVGSTTVTATATNPVGVSSTTFTVTVKDAEAPVVITHNLIIGINANGNASITASQVDDGSHDNCDIASLSVNPSSFTCANVGDNKVVLTVTDIHGNSTSASATVTVQDNIAPTVITKNITVTLVNGTASITAAQIDNGSYDNCSIAFMSVNPSSFNCTTLGNNAVTLTVTDVNGNVTSKSANVFVVGLVPTCSITSSPNNTGTVIENTNTGAATNQMYLGYGAQSMNLLVTANGAGPFTYSWTGSGLNNKNIKNPVFTPTAGGSFTFTCTATNSYGCQTTCSITICVIDARVPGSNANNGKVYLCHVPPGNPNNPQTLSISVNAVSAHLGNHGGDRLGICGAVCGFAKTESTAGGELYSSETEIGEINLVVYPNPSMEVFNFRLESSSTEEVSVVVYDISGRVIAEHSHMLSNEKIVITELTTPGVYFAEVTQGSFHRTVKLTKVN